MYIFAELLQNELKKIKCFLQGVNVYEKNRSFIYIDLYRRFVFRLARFSR